MSKVGTYSKDIDPTVIRRTIVDFAWSGSSGHIGCAFSLVEILATLFEGFVNINLEDKNDESRDILALSKGHGVMALYAIFRELGWLTEADVKGYFSPENKLKGLSSAHIEGIEISGGSLGQGLPVAVGMAKAAKIQKSGRRVFCIVGDGELNEGAIWESLMFASHHALDNLYIIVDSNKYQAMGKCEDILNMNDLKLKFESFNFEAYNVDGHSKKDLTEVFNKATSSISGKPKVVIADTVKGKGVSFMEHNNIWHYTRLDEEQYKIALEELK